MAASNNQGIALTDPDKIHRERKAIYNSWRRGELSDNGLRVGIYALQQITLEHRNIQLEAQGETIRSVVTLELM